MVTEAVGELTGEVPEHPAEVQIDLPVTAHLPGRLHRARRRAHGGVPAARRGHDARRRRRRARRMGRPLRPAAAARGRAARRRAPAGRVPAPRHPGGVGAEGPRPSRRLAPAASRRRSGCSAWWRAPRSSPTRSSCRSPRPASVSIAQASAQVARHDQPAREPHRPARCRPWRRRPPRYHPPDDLSPWFRRLAVRPRRRCDRARPQPVARARTSDAATVTLPRRARATTRSTSRAAEFNDELQRARRRTRSSRRRSETTGRSPADRHGDVSHRPAALASRWLTQARSRQTAVDAEIASAEAQPHRRRHARQRHGRTRAARTSPGLSDDASRSAFVDRRSSQRDAQTRAAVSCATTTTCPSGRFVSHILVKTKAEAETALAQIERGRDVRRRRQGEVDRHDVGRRSAARSGCLHAGRVRDAVPGRGRAARRSAS